MQIHIRSATDIQGGCQIFSTGCKCQSFTRQEMTSTESD